VTIVQTDTDRVDSLVDELLSDFPPSSTDATVFLGEQFDRGLAWVHFPEGNGGLELSPSLHQRITNRLIEGGAPSAAMRNIIGYGMVAPTIATHGTDEQKQRYLRPLFTGQEVWCQLFSEPGAGSDVAGLATRAERDGDEWVIAGPAVGPDQPRVAQAPGHHLLPGRHARTGRRGAPAAPDHRGGGVQRGLLHRRQGGRLRPPGRRG
jgi:alkylation response protein AidB-like acyl-CoA dehydrogenase